MTNLESILKSRDITLPTKVHLVKALVFPVVMYGCSKSWIIKKAEHQSIDAFELWCWRRLLRVPWTARRSNQSILKDISPEYSLEGLMLKLKLQYLGHLMRRTDLLKKTQFISVQSISCVQLFATPWTVARQASLSITNSRNLLRFMSIELVMPSNHLILCHPLLLLPSIFPASGSFQMSQFFQSGGQSIGASASVLP